MALVNTNKPVDGLQNEMVDDTVPEAVAGFIMTLQFNLTNPGNLCYANAAFRCWSWAGAHADDQVIAGAEPKKRSDNFWPGMNRSLFWTSNN